MSALGLFTLPGERLAFPLIAAAGLNSPIAGVTISRVWSLLSTA